MVRIGCVLILMILAGCGSRDEVALASGETFSWDRQGGQWLVINYWAEWCKPCYEEIPEFNELDQDSRVRVLGVNFDGIQGAELQRLIGAMGIEFATLVNNPAGHFGWGQPRGLPATFLINPEGEVAEARFGIQTRAALLAVIEGQPGSGQ